MFVGALELEGNIIHWIGWIQGQARYIKSDGRTKL